MKSRNSPAWKKTHRQAISLLVFSMMLSASMANWQHPVQQTDPDDQIPNIIINKRDPLLQTRKGIVYYRNEKLSGRVFEQTGQGAAIKEMRYLNGLLHGTTRRWYAGGQLHYEYRYRNGSKEGLHRERWRNGHDKSIARYHNNYLQDKVLEYFENGQLACIVNYYRGREQGHQRYWNREGQLSANYFVRNGRAYGITEASACGLQDHKLLTAQLTMGNAAKR